MERGRQRRKNNSFDHLNTSIGKPIDSKATQHHASPQKSKDDSSIPQLDLDQLKVANSYVAPMIASSPAPPMFDPSPSGAAAGLSPPLGLRIPSINGPTPGSPMMEAAFPRVAPPTSGAAPMSPRCASP